VIENEINFVITKRFKEIVHPTFVKSAMHKLMLPAMPTKDQQNIVNFFHWLNNQITGDTDDIPEGMRIHFITTNYDFLIESILDTNLASDDSHFSYSYRGFTPKLINGKRPIKTVFSHYLVQSLIKINGGFEIYKSGTDGFVIDYREKSEQDLKEQAPVLIVPNREQDYTGEYFQSIFPKAVKLLQESQALVIVGYSLPEEDALLRLLLRQFAEDNVDGTRKLIFFIDLMNEDEQLRKLRQVFPYHSYAAERFNIFTFSGRFTDWVNMVLSLK
jgi:hypothetical protein